MRRRLGNVEPVDGGRFGRRADVLVAVAVFADGVDEIGVPVSYTHLTLPTSDLV